MANENTILVISGDDLPPAAVRGIRQTIEPINGASNLARSVNGELINLGASQFKKYKTTITCSDMAPPAFDNVWPGDTLTIGCVNEFCYLTAGGTPQRTPVSGSSYVDGDYTFYRPELTVIVTSKSEEMEEYTADVPWTLEAEEV